jgi:tRNA(adenine34) deaminase
MPHRGLKSATLSLRGRISRQPNTAGWRKGNSRMDTRHTSTMPDEHEKFMHQALAEARQALAANEFPVGCVLVREGVVIARGRRVNSRGSAINELDHAEIMALRELTAAGPQDRTGITAYCTMEPCLMCYAALLLNGVRNIVFGYEDAMGGGTDIRLAHLTPLYRQQAVVITPYILRAESLALFHAFFANPINDYWQGSWLAEYTLRQQGTL